MPEITVEVAPVLLEVVLPHQVRVACHESLGEGPDAPTLARDLGGDALRDLGEHAVVDQHVLLGLAEHVDEPRGDDESTHVQCLARRGAVQGSYACEPVAPDAHIPAVARIAAPVHDPAASEDQVVGTLPPSLIPRPTGS